MNKIVTKPLCIYKGEWLIDALKREDCNNIPSNIVLDKTLPGIGATHIEIHALRNSIIIEPNVPVIKGKVKKHENLNLLGIYEGINFPKIKKYLLDTSVEYKKLLTTPEGFWKIKKAADAIGLNIYKEFFCLFDECERLNQDVGYRKKITNPVNDFFQFDNKAFVSATPLDIQHPKAIEQGFYKLKIDPQFDYKKDIELIVTNDIVNILLEKLESLKSSQCVCIFYNSTAGIDSIIHSLGMQYNYKTFCSPKSKRILTKLGFKNVETDFSLPLENYNFFTSRYFSAIDIEIPVKPDIIILTDLKQAEHTIIDPFTEAIQIQGRFRNIFEDGKNYNSLTHITNIKGTLKVKSPDTLDKQIAQYRKHYEYFIGEYSKSNNADEKDAISEEMNRSLFFEMLDKDRNLDDFAVNNKYNEERVKGYYINNEALNKAYEDTGFFNVNFRKELRFFLDEMRLYIRKADSRKKKIIRTIKILNKLKDPQQIEELRKLLIQDFNEADEVIRAYLKLGFDFIVSTDYSLSKIMKKLVEFESNEKRFCANIILEIMGAFDLQEKQDKNIFKKKLQEIYSRYGIIQKVTQTTITDYFEVSPDNSVKPAAYTLLKFDGKVGG